MNTNVFKNKIVNKKVMNKFKKTLKENIFIFLYLLNICLGENLRRNREENRHVTTRILNEFNMVRKGYIIIRRE